MMFPLRMATEEWRERLTAALERSGKTMREVSIAAGCGDGYVHSILKGGKEPGLERLAKVVKQLNVSFVYVLTGIEMTPAQEQLLALYEDLPEERKKLLLSMAEEFARGNGRSG